PLTADLPGYRLSAGRLENPRRYWVWYSPHWYRQLEARAGADLPGVLVEYDPAGREVARRTLPPLPRTHVFFYPPVGVGAGPALLGAGLGLAPPPAEAGVLVGTSQALLADFRAHPEGEMWLLLQFLLFTTILFIPGSGLILAADGGPLLVFTALM